MMTFEQRTRVAEALAGKDAIVCLCDGPNAGVVANLDGHTEAQMMMMMASMHHCVVECALNIYNAMNADKATRPMIEAMLSTLGKESSIYPTMHIQVRKVP